MAKQIHEEVGATEMANEMTLWETLIQSIMWNSSAKIEWNKDLNNKKGGYETTGNVTEQGIFKFFKEEIGFEGIIEQQEKLNEDNTLCVVPFTSKRKRGSVVVRDPSQEGTDKEVRVYCKGAPDFFLMEATEESDMSYPEMTKIAFGNEEHDINDECDVPS